MSRPAAVELLAALAAVLRGRRLRWYVFGAQAVVAYGRPRMTADVDVTVETADVPGLVAALRARGFAARVPHLDELVAAARVLPLEHEATAMPLDLVLAGPGLEEEFLARARPVDLGGLRVPVISAEDLVATKILAGRAKDLDDVRGILVERGGALDLDRTREVLAALEGALGQSDLLPLLDQLVAEAGPGAPAGPARRARRPGRPARPRPVRKR